jgi:hypothetical protein
MQSIFATEVQLSSDLLDHGYGESANHAKDSSVTFIQQRKPFHTAGQLESVFNRMDALDNKQKHVKTFFRGVNSEVASLANCNIKNKLQIWRWDDHHRLSIAWSLF